MARRTKLATCAVLVPIILIIIFRAANILAYIPIGDRLTKVLPASFRADVSEAILSRASAAIPPERIPLLERAVSVWPTNREAVKALCEDYSLKYARDEAYRPIQVCTEYLKLDSSANGNLLMGNALTRKFNAAGNCESLPYYEKALSLEPSNENALKHLGWSAGLCGELKKSAEVLEAHVRILEAKSSPSLNYADLIRTDRLMLSYVYGRLGDDVLAVKQCEMANPQQHSCKCALKEEGGFKCE
jgi:hypothetical protein